MRVDSDTFELGQVRLERSACPETGAPYLAFDLWLDGELVGKLARPEFLPTLLQPTELPGWYGVEPSAEAAMDLLRLLTSPEWGLWLAHQAWLSTSSDDESATLDEAQAFCREQIRQWPTVDPAVLAELFSSRYRVGLRLAAAFVSEAFRSQ